MRELIGNDAAKTQFKQYLEHNQAHQKPLFLILIGPEGIGKTSFLRNFTEEMLGANTQTDLFWMRDCSIMLGKAHPIQVEMPTTLKTIPLDNGIVYENKGVREINSWLQQSSISGKKVLLIENLQRMTNSAMNAFLKTCEEPLPNRYLFATAEHESGILPTILSRAMIVRFSPLSDEEMNKYRDEVLTSDSNLEGKELLTKLAMGKPGTLHLLMDKFNQNPELLSDISQLFSLLSSKGGRVKKLQILKKVEENGIFESVLASMIKECSERGDEKQAEQWIHFKKLLNANVAQENALRYSILSSEN